MQWITALASRFRALFNRARVEDELNEELRFHLDQQIEENRAAGMSALEAQSAAVRALGSVSLVKDHARDALGVRLVDELRQDVQYTCRTLLRNPGFTIVASLTLALGIGANAAIFSVINAVLLKPLPYPDPDRIVMLMNTWHGQMTSSINPGVSAPKLTAWRQSTTVFRDMAVYTFGRRLDVTNPQDPQPVPVWRVSHDFFRLFGAHLAQGRPFTTAEDEPGGPLVAIVSERFWRHRLGGSPQVLGQTLSLDSESFVIVGVLAEGFEADALSPSLAVSSDVWIPLQLGPSRVDDLNIYFAVARLSPGVSLAAARSQTTRSAEAVRQMYPAALRDDLGLSVERHQRVLIGDVRPSLLLLWAVVTFVLLIACTNTVNLLLVRASVRQRELAVRVATGASRGRIIRQLLTESVVLSFLSAGVGLMVGAIGVRGLLALQGSTLPRAVSTGSAVAMDWHVLAFTLTIAITAGLGAGLLPACRASRIDLDEALKTSGRTSSTVGANRTRATLVVSEVALALVLSVGAALLLRSFVALRHVNPGFDSHRVLTVQTAMVGPRYAEAAPVVAVANAGLQRLHVLPGVESAAATLTGVPLEAGSFLNVGIVGRPRADEYDAIGWYVISPRYFDTLKISLFHGRLFDERDTQTAPHVVLINQAMAKRYWANEDPTFDRILIGRGIGGDLEETVPRQIIGVVGDVHHQGLRQDPRPSVYVPLAQVSDRQTAFLSRFVASSLTWIVRTREDPSQLADSLQQEIRSAGGGLSSGRVRSMDEVSAASTARDAFEMGLITIFGTVAMLLAAIGLYGVLSFTVDQRRREIGIRLAVGAGVGEVRNLVMGQGVRLTAIGVVIGLGAAFGLTRLIETFLFGVPAHDPATFLVVPVVLSAIALIGVWLPARRAMKVDPLIALRSE